ncbi:tRNA epoxyqueuosine(34) reductase QueG [Microvirga terrae]|uniref:Epoxyqueuosine reductase n=1 Tax=Microvirga terrae TaxID=2740529 RepID=A0ABY5S1H1_9HYPH|nr:tRNA epoxyqueuosine(34) reductase QueG [Microvirga terrae]UVF21907.1 tRNA epoxyqueuosine(34) reductase QueG [Microvirga terrae]
MVRQDQVPAVLPRAPRGPGAGDGAGGALRQPGFLDVTALKQAFVERAKALGFDAVRIARPDAIPLAPERLNAWLEAGHHGSMDWMAETAERRADPRVLWPEVRSVILLGLNYGPDNDPLTELAERDRGYISVYARNRDYHDVIKGKLKEAAGFLAAKASSDVKVFVDTAPVMEKPLAEAAGLGWQGKHTVVVSREFGDWLFLGAIFTTAELSADEPERDRCGSCRRCLDVCPTQAFPAPYRLDARRCISYLTIEHKGHIPDELRPGIGNRIFGCDDCLAVCPWNKFAQAGREARLVQREDLSALPLRDLARLDDPAFRARFSGTPIKRTGRDRFVRNVLIAIGNSGDAALADEALRLLDDASPLVRAMAAWATGRLLPPDTVGRHAAGRLEREEDPDVREEWRRVFAASA